MLACRAAQQQLVQQPGHQAVTAQHHGDADDIVGQAGRLVFGNGDDADQGHHHQAEATNLPVEEMDLCARPAEMQFGHPARCENPVDGIEHQPGLGHHEQGAGQRQQQVEQNRQGGVQLAVTLEVADFLVQFSELAVQVAAFPQQQADQQQQRQKQQRALDQAGTQLAQVGTPWQVGNLPLQQTRHAGEPVEIQWLVAGDPEHLLVQGRAQGAGGALQLLLVGLQGDRLVEQRIELTIEALEQAAARVHQFQQGRAQFLGDVLGRLLGKQLLDISAGVAEQLALLGQLELVEANIGDFIGQAVVQGQFGQGLLLLVEDLRQQQAALQHVDLFIQGLVALVEGVQLLAGLQVLLGQLVEAFGGAQQVVGQLEVARADAGQELV